MKRLLAALLLLMATPFVHAEGDLLMARSQQTFPEAMLQLQNTIKEYGYTISRVQRVDIGLTKSGYKTDKYRIVFFGKAAEINALTQRHPQLMAYLPLKIVIFAEEDETMLVAMNPSMFNELVEEAMINDFFARWENDVRAILQEMREAGDRG
ncbi:MAG: DUF302 domain-containing protein [Granulosicoccaceae bacterium]|jgi:uncharacterized protein (DUF302 family)